MTRLSKTARQTLWYAGTLLDKKAESLTALNINDLLTSLGVSEDADEGVRITNLALGWGHGLISYITTKTLRSRIVGIGYNTSGQLGAGYTSHEGTQNMVSLGDEKSGSVVQLACGRESSFARIRNGEETSLYAWGNNMHGQLGLGRSKDPNKAEMVMTPSPMLARTGIDQVAAGLDHAVVVAGDKVLACGWGPDGQLGNGDQKDRSVFTSTSEFEHASIVKISSSTDYTLALDSAGTLYAWGNNEYGQCMLNSEKDRIMVPTKVMSGVKDIAAGGMFALITTGDGKVRVCGYGALGLGRDIIQVREPTELHIPKASAENINIHATTDYGAIILHPPDASSRLFLFGLGLAQSLLTSSGVNSDKTHTNEVESVLASHATAGPGSPATRFDLDEIDTAWRQRQDWSPRLKSHIHRIDKVALGARAMLMLTETEAS